MIYTKLRYLRKESGVSAYEMAELIGVKSNTAYLKKETGAVSISLKEARILSQFFEMSIEDLFFDDHVSPEEHKEQESPRLQYKAADFPNLELMGIQLIFL